VHGKRFLQAGRDLVLILGVLLREELADVFAKSVAILLLLALVANEAFHVCLIHLLGKLFVLQG